MVFHSSRTTRGRSYVMARQRERLGRQWTKPFDSCCICLQPVVDPLSCSKGHLICKECIFECLLAQRKDIKRKLASFTNHEKNDKGEGLAKLTAEKRLGLYETTERFCCAASASHWPSR